MKYLNQILHTNALKHIFAYMTAMYCLNLFQG